MHSECKVSEVGACVVGFPRAQSREQSRDHVRIVYKCFRYKCKTYIIYKYT